MNVPFEMSEKVFQEKEIKKRAWSGWLSHVRNE